MGAKGDSAEKLEKEFRDFQKEWRKFLTNDFSHLVTDVKDLSANVNTLVEQNTAIQQNLGKMEQNIIRALGARAYDWVGDKGTPEKDK